MKFKRSSGVFLHPTSLPGDHGIGSIGEEAFEFIDFLAAAEQDLWQICPLGPTGYGDSPYQCFSAFAGNPYLIDLNKLQQRGLLEEKDLESEHRFSRNKVYYGNVINFKVSVLRQAYHNFKSSASKDEVADFIEFKENNQEWLDDYALFRAIKKSFDGNPWWDWPDDIKFKQDDAVAEYEKNSAEEIEFRKFLQYIFYRQWSELKDYANQQGIKIVGDIPIFIAMDSADAWSNPEMFYFDDDLKPTKVAGVPPDFFSEDGQLWGNPLYDWDALKADNYQWWMARIKSILDLVDIVRIDHFRGFAAYWAVPADAKTAKPGEWEAGPGAEFFRAVKNELGELPIIVEDLGVIDEDVEKLRDEFDFPGMKILHFAFLGKEGKSKEKKLANEYLPHNYEKNCVVYTGTHDNNTTKGWYKEDLNEENREFLHQYFKEHLGFETSADSIVWDLIKVAWDSKAMFAITTLQDILELDSDARMNIPGTASGNWRWRYKKDMLTKELSQRLKKLTEQSDR